MSVMRTPRRPRGPYKAYLVDANQEIPEATARRWHNRHLRQVPDIVHAVRLENATYPAAGAPCTDRNMSGTLGIVDCDHHTDQEMLEEHEINDRVSTMVDDESGPEGLAEDDVQYENPTLPDQDAPEQGDIAQRPQHTCPNLETCKKCSPLRAACNGDPDAPVDEASDVSKGQFLALTMSFILRHNLSGVATQDLLELLNVLVPGCMPTTKYFLDKAFLHLQDEAQVHYCCLTCNGYVGSAEKTCLNCNIPIDKNKSLQEGNYFMVMPLAGQLTHLMEGQYCPSMKRNRATGDVYSDIHTGSEYPQEDSLLTLSFNCDGVPVFRSSGFSIWPIFVTVNEVPIEERHKNIVLAALWFGTVKPNVPILFRPFITELKILNNEGFQWEDKKGAIQTTKVQATICVCDAPARAMVQNMKQFNGEHGCGYCFHRGKHVPKGNGSTRVYPSEEESAESRTMRNTSRLADRAEEGGKTILGVKGRSALRDIPNFDLIRGVVPDYMHAVCLGVTKQFVNLWTNSKEHGEPFYIPPRKVAILDQRMADIRPPNEVKRMPRPLSERHFWKATEWRSFLILYSEVILQDILPQRFLRHWCLLASSMNALLQPTLTAIDLEQVTACVNKFVNDIPALYGEEQVSYNCHILLHIPEFVQYWGLPWAYSAFIYEDANGKLKDMYKGTRGIPQQMFKTFFRRRSLLEAADTLLHDADEAVLQLFTRLTNAKVHAHTQVVNKFMKMLGKYEETILTVPERVALSNSDLPEPQTMCVRSYKRCLIHGKLYSTSEYAESFKQDNSIIILDNGSFGIIDSLVVYKYCCECEMPECDCNMPVIFYQRLRRTSGQQFRLGRHALNRFLHEPLHVEPVGTTYACAPQKIKGKGLLLTHQFEWYLVKVPKFEVG